MGGGSSLLAPNGKRFLDSPDFPATRLPTATGQAEALDFYRSLGPSSLNWSYVSPPPIHFAPGERTGQYRTGEDHPVVDARGESSTSYEDFAVAIVDEIERPRFREEAIHRRVLNEAPLDAHEVCHGVGESELLDTGLVNTPLPKGPDDKMITTSTLLQAHLERVFNERDAARRGQAILELYAADATFYEQDAKYSGTEAIARGLTQLLGAFHRPSSSRWPRRRWRTTTWASSSGGGICLTERLS
jgi:hypothetical protein